MAIDKSKFTVFLKIIIAIPLLLLLSFNCHASSDKEIYELQERCGKRAHERFSYRNGIIETNNGVMLINYMYHYNKKMNICFALLETTNYKNNELISNIKELWDINENESYGKFFKDVKTEKPLACKVINKGCNSEYAWDSLVRPYIEE